MDKDDNNAFFSFDALQEPLAEEESSDNVLTKIFQRVKSTLSSTYSAPSPSPSQGQSTPSTSTASTFSTATTNATTTANAAPKPIAAAAAATTPPLPTNNNDNNSNLQMQTTALPPIPTNQQKQQQPPFDTLSPAQRKDQPRAIPTGPLRNSTPSGMAIVVDRSKYASTTVVPRRNPSQLSRDPKRNSSLFKINALDQSIVHDENTALAPPIISVKPAFGMQPAHDDDNPGQFSRTSMDSKSSDRSRLENISTADYNSRRLAARDASYDSDSRSIRSFSSSHQKGNSLTRAIRRIRGEGVNREYWMADENCKECYGCSSPFSLLRRKHHCRICGQIFCAKCASKIIPGASLGFEGFMRVCNYCLEIMQNCDQDGEIENNLGPSRATPVQSLLHSHYANQQVPPSPTTSSFTPEIAPMDGLRKFFHAGSLFLTRSRSNTMSGEQVGDVQSVPFRRSLALDDGNFQDSVLDPEIAPYMGDNEEEDHVDLWGDSPNTNSMYTPLGLQYSSGNLNESDATDSDEEKPELINREPHRMKRNSRTAIDMFSKDRSPINRRISAASNQQPQRNLRLKTRGLMRADISEGGRSPLDIRPASPYLGLNSPAAFHVGRHTRAASMSTSHVELNSASLQHMRRLLRQLLIRFEINQADNWDEVIMKLVLKASKNIQVLEGIDILQFVKIKKIPGGTAQDTMYVNGVVCTKNLADKKMARTLQSPRILILKFALEFQRVENHFISLGKLMFQEKQYLENMVTRILAFSPHLIIVEKTVARLALEILAKHNVAVAYNVKPEICAAIALCTKADIVTLDRLVQEPKLGQCGVFSVKTFVHDLIPNKRRSYLFFQDCPKEIFCTLVLRGGSLETLNRIKKIVRLMVWVSYNLKLETSLMKDQFAMTSALSELRLLEEERVVGPTDVDVSKLKDMIIPYKQTILSASPFVKFEPPYLLLQMINDEEKLKAIEKATSIMGMRELINAKIAFPTPNFYTVVPAHRQGIGRTQDLSILDGSYIDLSNDYEAKSRAWDMFLMNNIGPQMISPFSYQNIAILYSSVCPASKLVCAGPEIRVIHYYKDTDATLANYLQQICWESNYTCQSQVCGKHLRDHQRIYAHGNAKVVITVDTWPSPVQMAENSIIMWSKCKVCQVETQQAHMSQDTSNYSFGKFLELTFYHTDLTCRANICPHDINRDHVRYFGLNTLLVKIERLPIILYDIVFPPLLVRCKPDHTAKLKNQDLDSVRSLITRYWDSVLERIKNCIFDVVQPSKIEAAKLELLEMSRKVVSEKKGILQVLQQTYLNSGPTDTLALNSVRIRLHEKALEWNALFDNFSREYFNPDRDFRRSTNAQLKRLFDEKEFPVASDRANRAVLLNDLPVSLDSADVEPRPEDSPDLIPSILPALGTSPTLSAAFPTAVHQDIEVVELENDIEAATSQMAFPFMEPKVTRRLSMKMMHEFRPKLVSYNTGESMLSSTSENPSRSNSTTDLAPSIPNIPLPASNRPTTRVSSRISMLTLPSFDTLSLQGPRDLQRVTPGHPIYPSPPVSRSNTERVMPPLDRTPTIEKPNAMASTGLSRQVLSRGRPRKLEIEKAPPTSAPPSAPPVSNSSISSAGGASVSNRRSLYMANASAASSTADTSIKTIASHQINTRNRAMTQPIPPPTSGANNARSRYISAVSRARNPRAIEAREPTIKVFTSVKEAAKEESDDEEEYQSEGEGDEIQTAGRAYTFSLMLTDAMDEALGSEDPSAAGANHGAGGPQSATVTDVVLFDPSMMFLGDDDTPQPPDGSMVSSPPTKQQLQQQQLQQQQQQQPQQPPLGTSITTVTGTLNAALAKLPQLSEVAEGVLVERGSLIKTLSNFWQDRNSPNFTPLDFPLQPSEHVHYNSQIIVREDEPSSIIACTLCSPKYVKILKKAFQDDKEANAAAGISVPTGANGDRNKNGTGLGSAGGNNSTGAAGANVGLGLATSLGGPSAGSVMGSSNNGPDGASVTTPGSVNGEGESNNNNNNSSNNNNINNGSGTPGGNMNNGGESNNNNINNNNNSNDSAEATSIPDTSFYEEGIYDDIDDVEEALLSPTGSHFKYNLEGTANAFCKLFFAEQFHALRKLSGCEYSYIQSLARCMKWDAAGGKSGSSFLKTRDDRYIMKQLSKIELEAFIKFAPHYFEYMSRAYFHGSPTVLAKIFGFYRVGYKNAVTGKALTMDVLIMENLFYGRKSLQIYDLKGSKRNRYIQPTGKENEVLLDENFIEVMKTQPFHLRDYSKRLLSDSLFNDSFFLQSFNVMDYSLLVAVDSETKELVVGIVDFIRPFTWDKKLESWVKDAVGSKEPTIVSPIQYRRRFRSAMNRHLDMVPDRWFNMEFFKTVNGHHHHHHHRHANSNENGNVGTGGGNGGGELVERSNGKNGQNNNSNGNNRLSLMRTNSSGASTPVIPLRGGSGGGPLSVVSTSTSLMEFRQASESEQ